MVMLPAEFLRELEAGELIGAADPGDNPGLAEDRHVPVCRRRGKAGRRGQSRRSSPDESPLWGKTADDLRKSQAEVLILLKAYDDTFSQTVLARYSYRYDEFLWNRRFAPAFTVDGEGDLVLELKKVGEVA